MKQQPDNKVKAPEIYGDFWFNSDPITIHAMQGQVILLCFWDYTSDSSLQLLELAKEWYKRYAEMGLVVIGIHSPEFSFGRNVKLVETAVQQYGIHFPVATDNTSMMRDAYRVRDLPSMFLIERDGEIYSSHSGEGGYERTERAIQALLREAGFHGELPLLIEFSGTNEEVQQTFQRSTPPLRTGYLHGSLGNVEGYSPALPAEYTDARIYFEGKFYAQGDWLAQSDAFEYRGEPNNGYLALRYAGNNASIVLAAGKLGAVVRILLDDKSVAEGDRGIDLSADSAGNTFLEVNEPRLFHVVRSNSFGDHTLKIIPMEKGTTVYMFSFNAHSLTLLNLLGKNSYRNN